MGFPVYEVEDGDTLPIFFDTFAGSTGAPITLTGLAVDDIEIYKDAGTIERLSTSGYTVATDFDANTGIHVLTIDTSDNTTAGFYTVGAWFHVVVDAVTIDTQSVSFIAAAFRIVASEAVAGVKSVNVTHISGDATAADNLELDYDGTGLARANSTIGTVTTLTGHTAQTGDSFARLGVPAGASIAADLVVIESQTDDIGVAGAGLTALPISPANVTQLNGVAQSLLDLKDFADEGYDPVTNKITGCLLTDVVTALTGHTAQTGDSFAQIGTAGASLTDLGGMSTGMRGEVNAECDTAISDANLMRALASGTASGAGTNTTLVDTARTEPTTDYWKGSWLVITGGTPVLAGQARKISAFNFTTDTITVDRAFTVATDATTTYEIWPADFPNNMANLVISAGGVVDANTVELGGVAQSLTDLKDFADEGYDPVTNKITGCLLTDVVTTLTGHTAQTGDSFARIGALGASLTDLGGMSTGMRGEVNAECDTAISDANLMRALISGTADSGTTTTLVDTGLTQAIDYHNGAWLVITNGTLSGQARRIKDFDAASDTITVWRPFTVAVGTHTYEIWPNDGILPLPGQEAPPLEPMLEEAIAWLYKNFRNRKDQSTTLWQLYADNETTVDSKATVSDAAGVATKQEIVTGP